MRKCVRTDLIMVFYIVDIDVFNIDYCFDNDSIALHFKHFDVVIDPHVSKFDRFGHCC